jgi:phage-related holin
MELKYRLMDRGVIEACTNIWSKFTEFPLLKTLLAFTYAIISFSFGEANQSGLLALFLLILIDFVTAISAAYTRNIPIRSSKIFITAVKMLIYFTLIACGIYVGKAAPLLSSFVDETILSFLALTEIVSILENAGKMGYAIPKKLLKQLENIRDEK